MRRFLFIILTALLACAASHAATRKVIYVVMDGIPADYIERVHPATVFDVARHGGYARASTGGEIGGYSQTPTISAVGYMNILTGTWLNKHNVPGNSNLDPNYNYWSLFRIAKQQPQNFTTALFSSWTDNRTVLIGAGKPETDSLSIDIVRDGYELEGSALRRADGSPDVFAIDSVVCREAAECIRTAAPDLSWVYLWYTDEAFTTEYTFTESEKVTQALTLYAKWTKEAAKYYYYSPADGSARRPPPRCAGSQSPCPAQVPQQTHWNSRMHC